MTSDIRYCEFRFLNAIKKGEIDVFNPGDKKQEMAVGISGEMYIQMAAALVEDLYLRCSAGEVQTLVSRLRGEVYIDHKPNGLEDHSWNNPRKAVHDALAGRLLGTQTLEITYRGLQRIEELRDLLRHDRILERFGVLLSMQYFPVDCEDALGRGSDTAVSVLYVDMDHFKRINTKFGQGAGDVVMKSYLEAVRESLGILGTGYRGVGDEVACLLIGQSHKRATEIAEAIRHRVKAIRCEYRDQQLPPVTVSIGVATSPPEHRTMDIEIVAESRKRKAKRKGRDRVVAE